MNSLLFCELSSLQRYGDFYTEYKDDIDKDKADWKPSDDLIAEWLGEGEYKNNYYYLWELELSHYNAAINSLNLDNTYIKRIPVLVITSMSQKKNEDGTITFSPNWSESYYLQIVTDEDNLTKE
jgi:hypothetical protein